MAQQTPEAEAMARIVADHALALKKAGFRKRRHRERQLAAIAATSVDLDDDDLDTTEVRALTKEARRANALRRSAGSSPGSMTERRPPGRAHAGSGARHLRYAPAIGGGPPSTTWLFD